MACRSGPTDTDRPPAAVRHGTGTPPLAFTACPSSRSLPHGSSRCFLPEVPTFGRSWPSFPRRCGVPVPRGRAALCPVARPSASCSARGCCQFGAVTNAAAVNIRLPSFAFLLADPGLTGRAGAGGAGRPVFHLGGGRSARSRRGARPHLLLSFGSAIRRCAAGAQRHLGVGVCVSHDPWC